jgi:E3 ubiquitin-protein ligase SHPRH
VALSHLRSYCSLSGLASFDKLSYRRKATFELPPFDQQAVALTFIQSYALKKVSSVFLRIRRCRESSQILSFDSSIFAPPNNQNMSSPDINFSDEAHRELTDYLIEFVSQQGHRSEPPRKRQKVKVVSSSNKEPELEHIVVHQSRWEIPCTSSKLSELDTPVERSNIRIYVFWDRHSVPEYIEIFDEQKPRVLQAKIPPKECMEDVHLALLVDQESKGWARLQGRLWTEFAISLYQKNGLDCIGLDFTIKWNTTTSPYNVLNASSKTPALLKVM